MSDVPSGDQPMPGLNMLALSTRRLVPSLLTTAATPSSPPEYAGGLGGARKASCSPERDQRGERPFASIVVVTPVAIVRTRRGLPVDVDVFAT